MGKVTWHDLVQGSDKWKQFRKVLWTGSRAIKLLQGKPLPDDSNTYATAAMRRGTALEPVAIREYERRIGRKVWRPGFATNSTYTNAGYSPDGIDGKVLLEVKCPGDNNYEQFQLGHISLDYIAQIQFGMVVTNLRTAVLIAYNPDFGESMVIIEVPYDKKIANNIRKKLRQDMKKRQLVKADVSV